MRKRILTGALFILMMQVSCAPTPEPRLQIGKAYAIDGVTYQPEIQPRYKEIGYASWYGGKFHNRRTANGEVFDKEDYTGAHKTLPLPSIVKVTNLENGRSLKVKINDRGPFVRGRIIDVSENAARDLGFKGRGTARVVVELDRQASLALLKDPTLKVKEAEKKLIEEAYMNADMSPLPESHTNLAQNDKAGKSSKFVGNVINKKSVEAVEVEEEKLIGGETEKVEASADAGNVALEPMHANIDNSPANVKETVKDSANKKVIEAKKPVVNDGRPKSFAYRDAHKTAEPVKAAPSKSAQGKSVPASQGGKATAKVSAAGSAYVIQVASTPSEADAKKIKSKLANFTSEIQKAKVKGKDYFRVRVTGFSSDAEAKKDLINVRNKGFKDAFVTKN